MLSSHIEIGYIMTQDPNVIGPSFNSFPMGPFFILWNLEESLKVLLEAHAGYILLQHVTIFPGLNVVY